MGFISTDFLDYMEKNMIEETGPNKEKLELLNQPSWNTQEDGQHYTKLGVQPMQYSMANNLNVLQHTAIKYITRYKDKNGLIDLKKARHCINMLIEWELVENSKNKL